MTPTTSEREAVIAEMREEAAVQIKTVWIDRATFDRWIAALTREQREGVCPKCNGAGGERWHEADGSENGQRCDVCDGFGTQPEAPGAGCVCGNPEAPYTVHRTDGPCYQQEAPGAVACHRLWSGNAPLMKMWMSGDVPADEEAKLRIAGYTIERAYTTPPAPVPAGSDGAVAWLTPQQLSDLRQEKPWTAGAFGEFSQRKRDEYTVPLYAATQPAPVDVRGLRALANDLRNEAGDWDIGSTRGALKDAANRIDALLSGQPAGVCVYPDCNCPFDAPADPNWCARGLPKAALGGGGRG